MKLRNKKTGEIVEAESCNSATGMIGIFYEDKDGQVGTKDCFETLAELNDEWEDYKPKEPLIKDEKIRKAVRAWAELNDIKDILHKVDVGRNECCSYIHDMNCEMLEIGFKEKLPLGDNASYAIAELCGEE